MIKIYTLPFGKIYVNETDVPQAFYVQGDKITLKPRQVHLEGGTHVDLLQYMMAPTFWENKHAFETLLKKEGTVNVLLDVSKIDRWGDNIMMTIIPKGYAQFHSKNVFVDVLAHPAYAEVWLNNPYVRNVYIGELPSDSKYEITHDLNALEMVWDSEKNCADVLLERAGLHTVNKTPYYHVPPETRDWALRHVEGLDLAGPLWAVATESTAAVRTWPRWDDFIKEARSRGRSVLHLDEKVNGKYKYTFSEMAALMSISDVVVTNDSAALHLAGALKKRVFAIFGHTDGKKFCENYEKATPIQSTVCKKAPCWWSVPCAPGKSYREKENAVESVACLSGLDPKEVLDKIDAELAKARKVLAVMLTYNMVDWSRLAADSLRSKHDVDLFVVDNASEDGTQAWLEQMKIPFVSKRCGVAAAQNIGLERFLSGSYDYFLLLNNDIALRFDTVDKLVELMEKNPEYWGMTSQEVLNTSPWMIDYAQPSGNKHIFEIIDIPPSAYSCTIFTRKALMMVGPFDEHFTPRYIEDNDFNLRIRLAGGKFGKTGESIYYHLLGGVLTTNQEERRSKDVHWIKNIAYYQEKWGIHPHEPQSFAKLGVEHRQGELAKAIREGAKTVTIRRNMGGWGDIIFISTVARTIKQQYPNVKVLYDIPSQFHQLIGRYPYIDGIGNNGFVLDLTDVEFRWEWQEVSHYGSILSSRTKIHNQIAGFEIDSLKPDYFVKTEESEWAEKQWQNAEGHGKRIVVVPEGSNPMKTWHGMTELAGRLRGAGHRVIVSEKSKNFFEMAAIISKADLVISPDTGLSNVAGALGIPVLTLFSNRNPQPFTAMFDSMVPMTGVCPLGREHGCDYKVPCAGTEGPFRPKEQNLGEPECFKNLSVDEMIAAVKIVLE